MRGVCDASGAAIVHITNATTIRIETSPLKSCMPQMRPGAFEPPTNSLEGCCSIHLSYGRLLLRIADCELRILGGVDQRISRPKIRNPRIGAAGFEPATSWSQTRRATGLRHAPKCSTTSKQDVEATHVNWNSSKKDTWQHAQNTTDRGGARPRSTL